jgi:hypothetical protein
MVAAWGRGTEPVMFAFVEGIAKRIALESTKSS